MKRTGLLVPLLLAAAGLLGGVLVVEILLRAAGFSHPQFYRYDRYTGSSLRPGAEGWWRREGEAYVRINSDGLRDREHARRKPPGVWRVAVLGDSYAEALQVDQERTFWAVLGRELRACAELAGRKIEVINFGKSGFGTAEELLTLRHKVWDYSPDLVLLAFTAGNDVCNNSRDLEPNKRRPFFLRRGGRLVLDPAFERDPIYRSDEWLSRRVLYAVYPHARTLQLVWAWRERRAVRAAARATAPAAGTGGEAGLDATVYAVPTDPRWREAWAITGDLLRLMQAEVSARGARFLVAVLTDGIQVHPDAAARRRFLEGIGAADFGEPARQIRAVGAAAGFPVVDLAPEFLRAAEADGTFFHGFPNTAPGTGHWNESGHRLAGEILAREVCTLIGPSGP